MDREKRERLVKKREALKAKREIENLLRRIDDLTQYFDRHKIEYHIHLECERAYEALYSYPAVGSGLNWEEIPNSKKVFYSSIDERNEILSTVIMHCLEALDTTFVIWDDGYKPILEITANLVAEHADALAEEDSRMWILNLEKDFCLEYRDWYYIAWTPISSPTLTEHL